MVGWWQDLRDKTALRSPNLGVCFEHAQNKRHNSAIIGDHGDQCTMSGVSTTLMATLTPSFHCRSSAVRTPTRSDGGISNTCEYSFNLFDDKTIVLASQTQSTLFTSICQYLESEKDKHCIRDIYWYDCVTGKLT